MTEAYKNHILANQAVRDALLAGNSGAIRNWYNTHAQSTHVISCKKNRDGLLDALGLQLSVSIIAKLRAFALTQHPWALIAAELIRLIDGGSGPDFGDDAIRATIVGLAPGVTKKTTTSTTVESGSGILHMEFKDDIAPPDPRDTKSKRV